ncbi:MAG: SIMPL domain-containing protein [Longimicrobiales bacterium]|jgi:uncharacterized protein YggE
MNTTLKIATLATILTACATPAASSLPSPPQEAVGEGWIQVSGAAAVSVAADRAMVSFAMETRARDASEAAGQNADAMTAVLDAVRGAGFDGLELETFGYALNPEYSTTNNQRTREIIAYTVHNNVRATIEDVDAVGRLVDTAIGSGANRVAQISFFAADTEDARREALAMAVESAREDAEVIASSLGYELGAPLEINGGANRITPQFYSDGPAMSRAAATPIEVGDQSVSANVSIRFALGREVGG